MDKIGKKKGYGNKKNIITNTPSFILTGHILIAII